MEKSFAINKENLKVELIITNEYNPASFLDLNDDSELKLIKTDIFLNGANIGKSRGFVEKFKITKKENDKGKYILPLYVTEKTFSDNLEEKLAASIRPYMHKYIYIDINEDAANYIKELYKLNKQSSQDFIDNCNKEFEEYEDDEVIEMSTGARTIFTDRWTMQTEAFKKLNYFYKHKIISDQDIALFDKNNRFDLNTYFTFYNLRKIDILELVKLGEAKEKEKLEKEREAEEAERIRIAALIEKAKTDGPQVVSHYTAPCNDPKEECSLDYVYVYVDAEGKYSKERFHTW